jgi:hypothetical protein
MKKIALLSLSMVVLVVLVLMVGACSKDDADKGGNYVVRFKANGTLITYTLQSVLLYQTTSAGDQYLASITGSNDVSNNIGLLLYDDAPIGEGTYLNYIVEDQIVKGVLIAHLDASTGVVFSSGAIDAEASVTITEMNATTVRGTFQGVVKHDQHDDIAITEGEFFVKRVN